MPTVGGWLGEGGGGGVRRCPGGMDTHSGQSFGQFSAVEL